MSRNHYKKQSFPRRRAEISFDAGNVLLCPKCKEEFLHQDLVEVFFREKEDCNRDSCCVHIRVGTEKRFSLINSDMDRNPSYRRDGLLIRFWCEECTDPYGTPSAEQPEYFWLAIYQHKGCTFFEWLQVDENGFWVMEKVI